ncbi:unnamed protein product [Aspergillus oryzae RIB40]|uniref:DNA, SC012 n=1 Tax=Aspergillus oryzae (strain ATCC 42149 / RIB 40) TaxID=510516 RepID=Q2UD46_ASPOR|nr:unnamed protein product [Aspergillus oryzae RIB40]BAE60519.1 unnamed protein product [Aspergillus oryzae RIB40]
METESSCSCSIDALQILTDVRNVDTVVEFETILDLVQRVYGQGQAMLSCKDCRKLPLQSSSFLTIPALTDHCLSLFEAVCSAYSITRKNCLFDANILAFEQPLPQFICIRSKVQLGETDLDEAETGIDSSGNPSNTFNGQYPGTPSWGNNPAGVRVVHPVNYAPLHGIPGPDKSRTTS